MELIPLGRIYKISFMPPEDDECGKIFVDLVDSKDKYPITLEFKKGAYIYIKVEDQNEFDGL